MTPLALAADLEAKHKVLDCLPSPGATEMTAQSLADRLEKLLGNALVDRIHTLKVLTTNGDAIAVEVIGNGAVILAALRESGELKRQLTEAWAGIRFRDETINVAVKSRDVKIASLEQALREGGEAIERAAKAERDAVKECAEVCREETAKIVMSGVYEHGYIDGCNACAKLIEALVALEPEPPR